MHIHTVDMSSMTIEQAPPYTEPRRPQFHFSPAQGWMNDPNGLVYYDGEYHLFYQHYPNSTHWSTMHWGHAVSTDLIHWAHLPIALHPDANGPIFSGSVVVDANNTCGLVPGGGLVAMFSYQNQSQGIAFSRNSGRTWEIHSGNPVIPSPGSDFRDPKVFWHEDTARWIMVIAAHDRVELYSSLNLRDWSYLSEFGHQHGAHGGVWECPDLFPMTVDRMTKWVLLVSIGAGSVAGGSGTQYFIGSFDGTCFTSDYPDTTTLWFDYGKDDYAGVTWNNTPDGRRLFIAWMNNWEYAHEIRASVWNGVMTLPRELTLREVPGNGLRIVQKPIPELANLRSQPIIMKDVSLSDAAELALPLQSGSLEIVAEFELGTASEFGFKVLKGGEHFTTIGYHVADAALFIDRRNSGEVDFHAAFAGVCRAPSETVNGSLRVHLFIDRSTIEVFSGDGRAVMSALVLPLTTDDSLGLYARNGVARLTQLEIYILRSVWS